VLTEEIFGFGWLWVINQLVSGNQAYTHIRMIAMDRFVHCFLCTLISGWQKMSESHSEPEYLWTCWQNRGDDYWMRKECWLWSCVHLAQGACYTFYSTARSLWQREIGIRLKNDSMYKQSNWSPDQAIARKLSRAIFQMETYSQLSASKYMDASTCQLITYGYLGDDCGAGQTRYLKAVRGFIGEDFCFIAISTWMIWTARDYIFDLLHFCTSRLWLASGD